MHLRIKTVAIIAWLVCAAACLIALITLVILMKQNIQAENTLKLAGDAAWILFPMPFAITAALIVSRQPGNVVGWLLMAPALLSIIAVPSTYFMKNITTPPADLSFLFLVYVWLSSWSWLVLIFPVILLPLLFPTGRPPTPRWRWVLYLAAALAAMFIFIATFAKELQSVDQGWAIPNPIGFLSDAAIQIFMIPWEIVLIGTVLLSAASLFVRYRRSGSVERKQIKWLLYTIGVFTLIYSFGFWINNDTNPIIADTFNLVFNLAILAFPISIAIAVLNYRLYDIDIIIHRTLTYAVLTAALALVYFGSILVLQQVFRLATGSTSPIAIVISTLAIAALFAPLRKRVQDFIDRRFYRQKYDAARALEGFSTVVRNEVEVEALTGSLAEVVITSIQPQTISLWIKSPRQSPPAGQA
jgi:hypothetical protein